MYKKSKELKKEQELEDIKNQAADLAVNRQIHSEASFNKILQDIKNAATNTRKDKFTKKIGFVVCNEFYKDKACLDNLPDTKDDFDGIIRIVNMMDIKEKDMFNLIDGNRV